MIRLVSLMSVRFGVEWKEGRAGLELEKKSNGSYLQWCSSITIVVISMPGMTLMRTRCHHAEQIQPFIRKGSYSFAITKREGSVKLAWDEKTSTTDQPLHQYRPTSLADSSF